MKTGDIQVRRDICEGCVAKCPEFLAGQIDHSAAVTRCPNGIWHAHPIDEPEAMLGAGDLIARLAKPIALMMDRISIGRTKLASCGACESRRSYLNKAIPFSNFDRK